MTALHESQIYMKLLKNEEAACGRGTLVSVPAHYLLNQVEDFDQTCIDILLGGKESIRFRRVCTGLKST